MCHERPAVWDGPMNSDIPTRCTPWICVPCWRRIADRDQRCPICRENLSKWILRLETGDERPDDSDESLSGEEDEAVRSMPLCGGGFDNIVIRDLLDIHTLLGIDGGVVLDTRILHHSSPCEMFPGPPYEHEIFITIGVSGIPITLSDATRALRSIPRDAWQRGRSYYWEGVVLSPGRRSARVRWGS